MKQILISILLICLFLHCGGNRAKSTPTMKTTDFTLEQLGGGKITLSALKGKVILVDFWATWCPPCRAAIPHLIRIYNTYKDQGLVVLGVSLDQDKSALEKYNQDINIPYPILLGTNEVAKAYDVQGIPTLIIFDKKGKIALREVGFSEENISNLEAKISALLK
ncbi:MAG: TlpA family protein disulfide reductase [candidate division WOR-3 bacterium]|nr:TlpA family protein disulfide reductase [candidate division WOR-3 bacterium]